MSHRAPPPGSVWRAWLRRCERRRRPRANLAPWRAAAPRSSSTAGACRSSSASTWRRARAGGLSGPQQREPPCPPARPACGGHESPSAWAALLGAAPAPRAAETPALSLKPHISPWEVLRYLVPLTTPGDPVSSGDPFPGDLGCSCHKPLGRPCVTLCPSDAPPPGPVSLRAPLSILGPVSLNVPLCLQGPCLLVPPPLLPQNTDLLVGSLLHTPRAPLLGPGAGGWPPAPFEGRRGSPSRESTRVPHLVTGIQAGLLGCWGWAVAWGLSPGWTQASQGHVAGHTQAPGLGGRRPVPASSRGTWPQAGA